MAPDELVLGIPRDRLPGKGGWRGVLFGDIGPIIELIAAEGTYRPRSECETDPSWKQVIPYVVVRFGDGIFLMRRTRAGSDERLHERYSIGVGGHVNPEDGGLAGGLVREWSEEMAADWRPHFELIGLLNDDSDPVGAVHLGVVYLVQAGGPLAIRERDKLEGDFVSSLEVLRIHDRLETWSALVFDHLTSSTAGLAYTAMMTAEQDR